MNVKRYLLKKKLEEALKKVGTPLSLYLESRIVFSHPMAEVVDHYFYEQFCYNADLPYEIDTFESDVRYSEVEMQLLEELISNFAVAEKLRHVEKLDFDRIRRTFAEALVLLEVESEAVDYGAECELIKNCSAKTTVEKTESLEEELVQVKAPLLRADHETANTIGYAILSGFIAICGVAGINLLLHRKGA